MKNKIRLIAASLVFCCFCLQMQAFAGTALTLATKLYGQGHYQEAVTLLRQAACLEPGNAVVHYYLANALLALNERDQAMEEYGICLWLAPSGQAADYCRKALQGFWGAVPPSLNNAKQNQGQTATGTELNRTLSLIHRQASFEKRKQETAGEAMAANSIRIGEVQAARIKADADNEINRLLNPPTALTPGVIAGRGGVNAWDPQWAQARADELRKQAESAQKSIKDEALARAESYRGLCKESQKSLDEQVGSVEKLLQEPVGLSGAKLKPYGTDLYVRFYGDLNATYGDNALSENDKRKPAINVVEAKAKELQGRFPNGRSGGSSLNITKDVHGKIIDTR